MRLPRRVPWKSISELDQVCSWIFSDETDIDAKILAVKRLSAWKAVTALPHALESTLSLVTVTLMERSIGNSPDSFEHLSLRQSYAAAIIRLVNGLVDPLQSGAFARSIASIAAQLGLPLWLVELRHSATHEDLPSLELLREAAQQSLSWLFQNYFLRVLNPSSAPLARTPPLRPVTPLLKRYKSILKLIIRDASLRNSYKAEVELCLRDIERWVAEATVAASVTIEGFEWGEVDGTQDDDMDAKERWALDRLCDALLFEGFLVPFSKKKRAAHNDNFMPSTTSIELWQPLLTRLQSHHPRLSTAIANRITDHLLSESIFEDFGADVVQLKSSTRQIDQSFNMCLARWARWAISVGNVDRGADSLRSGIVVALATGLRPGNAENARDAQTATALLKALCAGNAQLEQASSLLLSVTIKPTQEPWSADDNIGMHERLNILMSSVAEEAHHASAPPASTTRKPGDISQASNLAPGWRLLDSSWKACPIGIYVNDGST